MNICFTNALVQLHFRPFKDSLEWTVTTTKPNYLVIVQKIAV